VMCCRRGFECVAVWGSPLSPDCMVIYAEEFLRCFVVAWLGEMNIRRGDFVALS